MRLDLRTTKLTAALAAALVLIAAGACVGFFLMGGLADESANKVKGGGDHARSAGTFLTTVPFKFTAGADVFGSVSVDQIAAKVMAKETQLASIKVEPAAERLFPVEKEAVGSIDFNEEMSVQVFTNYPGRIIELFAQVGDEVTKGQRLFTIDSPDLIQAESTLISAAGVLDLTTRALNRAKGLFATHAIAQKDVEQATAEHQTAEGALKAARDNVRLFGKSDADIDRIIAERRLDPVLVIPSPIGLISITKSQFPRQMSNSAYWPTSFCR